MSNLAGLITDDLLQLSAPQQEESIKLMDKWFTHELTQRHSRAISSRISSARFKRIQTIDQFDFGYNKSTKSAKTEYLALFNQTIKGHLPRAVFVGMAGLGKTHLARALGYGACQAKTAVLFVNTATMVNELAAAKASVRLEAELNKYRRPKVLILDEVGYVTLDIEESNLFFQVISARHDQGLSTIITTNHPFGEWNQMFSNNATAHAIVDRITDGASIFYFEGVSYRGPAQSKKLKK